MKKSQIRTWHRTGWKQGTTKTNSKPNFYIDKEVSDNKQGETKYKGNVYIRNHTHAHTHSNEQTNLHRTIIHMPWTLGMKGIPEAQMNLNQFYTDLKIDLLNSDVTLNCIKSNLLKNCNDDDFEKHSIDESLMQMILCQLEDFTNEMQLYLKMNQNT